jgi:hypothetical protein
MDQAPDMPSETEQQDLVHLGNGTPVILAGTGKVLGSFAVDIAVIIGAAVAAYFISSRTAYADWQPLVAALGTWIAGPAVYGFLFFTGRTLGCLAAGSAFVRNSDGGWPGPFRMAWVCFQHYVLVVILIFGIIASGGAGTSGSSKRRRIFHRHIDVEATRGQHG